MVSYSTSLDSLKTPDGPQDKRESSDLIKDQNNPEVCNEIPGGPQDKSKTSDPIEDQKN